MAGGSTRRRSMTAYSVAGHAQGTAAGDERMERYHEYVGRHRAERSVWPGAAFIVEALLLLVFLAGSLAVLMELNADADAAGRQSADLMEAMTLASNAAEEFAANPELVTATGALGDEEEAARVRYGTGLVMTRTVEAEPLAAGTMYRARIAVWHEGAPAAELAGAGSGGPKPAPAEGSGADGAAEPVYTLETACYVANDGGRVSPSAAGAVEGESLSVVLDDPAAPPVTGAAEAPAADGTDATPTEGEVSRG